MQARSKLGWYYLAIAAEQSSRRAARIGRWTVAQSRANLAALGYERLGRPAQAAVCREDAAAYRAYATAPAGWGSID